MIAGGGASVVYSDTICDYGYGKELANYGEYSGKHDTCSTLKIKCLLVNDLVAVAYVCLCACT